MATARKHAPCRNRPATARRCNGGMAPPRFRAPPPAGRLMARTVAPLAAAALAACASLPPQAPRTASFVDDDVADTTLARVVAASTPADATGLSGFRLLADGGQAWEARLALIDRA